MYEDHHKMNLSCSFLILTAVQQYKDLINTILLLLLPLLYLEQQKLLEFWRPKIIYLRYKL